MMSTQKEIPVNMVANPTVFALKNTYQIFMPFSCEVIVWVKVGEEVYYDESNGILRSNTEKLVAQYLWRNNLACLGEILINGD